MLRKLRPRLSTPSAWTWLCEPGWPAPLRPPNVSGWDDKRWLDTRAMRGRWNSSPTGSRKPRSSLGRALSTTETEEAAPRALATWGWPELRKEHATSCSTSPASARPVGRLAEGPYRAMRQNALRQLIGIGPDTDPAMRRMTTANRCDDYTRSELLRRPRPRPARVCPRSSRGCRSRPEPGSRGGSFLSRSAGLALAVYGASKIPLAAFERGSHRPPAPTKILVSIFFDGGIDSLNVLAPIDDSTYHELRPNIALPSGAGASRRTSRLFWHPSAASLRTLHGEDKVSVFPAIGYTSPDQSHFTSRHYYEIGEVQVGAGTGWLGRYLEGRDRRQPAARRLAAAALADARDRPKPVAAIEASTAMTSGPLVGRTGRSEMFKTSPTSARCPPTPPA